MSVPAEWLLEGEAWIEYRTRLDLLGQSEDELQVVKTRPGYVGKFSNTGLACRAFGIARYGDFQP